MEFRFIICKDIDWIMSKKNSEIINMFKGAILKPRFAGSELDK